jgi:hypothetical protein
MTIDQARVKAGELWCHSGYSRPAVWITGSGRRAVGFIDGRFRYRMGVGDTWESAFLAAARSHE